LVVDPDNPAILLRLGVVLGESGQLGRATSEFKEVIRIDPTSPDPWNDLAVIYGQEHDAAALAHAKAEAAKLDRSG
jgi:Flp pilus assembly protein TadD